MDAQRETGQVIREAARASGTPLARLARDRRIKYARLLRLLDGERVALPGELEGVLEILRNKLGQGQK